eukprot:5029273-Pyramimonas_sp.AAC.1
MSKTILSSSTAEPRRPRRPSGVEGRDSGEQHQAREDNQIGKRDARGAEVSRAKSPSHWPPP